jgi:hypothetical protein
MADDDSESEGKETPFEKTWMFWFSLSYALFEKFDDDPPSRE